MSPHYDTTHASPDELRQYNKQTDSQDNRIACFFKSNPGELFTPWEVSNKIFEYPGPPITSIRRSMSDLTKIHVLTRTPHKKLGGPYNRRSYAWTLNEKYRETQELLEYNDPAEQVQGLLDELAAELYPQEATEPHLKGIITSKVVEDQKETGSVKQAKTSPQGKLFNVAPLEPVNCKVCGKLLTAPYSIQKGIGPVCLPNVISYGL